MNSFHGMPIIESLWMTKSAEQEVARTWRERLCSWPWRPLQRTKTVMVQVPSDQVLSMGGKFVMHPETRRRLFRELETR